MALATCDGLLPSFCRFREFENNKDMRMQLIVNGVSYPQHEETTLEALADTAYVNERVGINALARPNDYLI
jgi:hypothetical protein